MTVQTPQNLGALLDETVDRYGDSPALNFFEESLCVGYAGLREHVNQAANALLQFGVKQGSHVGIMASNSLMFYCAWFGLAKIGAVTIAINNRYTARELDYVLDDSRSEFLILDSAFLEVFRESDAGQSGRLEGRIILSAASPDYPNWEELVQSQPVTLDVDYAVQSDDLVNIQYTSGTTGFPKGCMLTHRFWMHSSKSTSLGLGFELQRALYNQNFFYMDGPFVSITCMHTGACLFIANKPSGRSFARWIRDFRIQYCYFYEALYKVPETEIDSDNELKLLHTFGFNKACHADLERRFGCRAREAYGSTECGAVMAMPWDESEMAATASCGKPVADRWVRIVDDGGAEVAGGETGELWVKGPGMMLGYYRNSDATSATMEDGWIKTGDLFRQDENGFYFIVGRKKDMVRRNGENIACREVEAVLREMQEIREAAVVPLADERVGEEVKAYVLLQDGFLRTDVTPQKILDHCAGRLAIFKVPRFIEYRDAFPMTESARVEKKKLLEDGSDPRLNSYDRVDDVWR